MAMGLTWAWILAGLLAVHIGSAVDKAQGKDWEPCYAWIALLGLFGLVMVVIYAVLVSSAREK